MKRFQYACSVLHCLPATMAKSTSVASRTVLRSGTVREWAVSAGLPQVEILPVDDDFWRFYRLSAG